MKEVITYEDIFKTSNPKYKHWFCLYMFSVSTSTPEKMGRYFPTREYFAQISAIM